MTTNSITSCNLNAAASTIGQWLDEHPVINKIVVVANHLFRALAMAALMAFLPFSFPVNLGLSVAASVFYRLTIERFCHFQFAIPSMLGGNALHLSLPSTISTIQEIFSQTVANIVSVLGAISLTLYALHIIWISHHAVNSIKKPINSSCCCA